MNSIAGGWHDKNGHKKEASWSDFKSKVRNIKELEKGRPNKGVANQFSIPGSTLATWKNNKEKIFEAFQNSSLKRQRVKTWIYEKLNEALLKWFTSMCGSNNIPISGPILLEKAHGFAKAFNPTIEPMFAQTDALP